MAPSAPYSALWPLHVAIAQALNADVSVVAICGSDAVFGDDVPMGRPVPYIQFGAPSELAQRAFMRNGQQTFAELHLFAPNREVVLALYDACHSALDGKLLTMPGIAQWRGALSFTTLIRDPTGVSHGIAQYECDSVEAL